MFKLSCALAFGMFLLFVLTDPTNYQYLMLSAGTFVFNGLFAIIHAVEEKK